MRNLKSMALALGLLVNTACGIPIPGSPSKTLDPMQQWAADHAHESCVYRPSVNRPILIPVGTQQPGDLMANISACNPAE